MLLEISQEHMILVRDNLVAKDAVKSHPPFYHACQHS